MIKSSAASYLNTYRAEMNVNADASLELLKMAARVLVREAAGRNFEVTLSDALSTLLGLRTVARIR